jgi:fructokinase
MVKRIVAFGEMLWDLLPTGRKLGGAPFNFIYRVACTGAQGTMVSRLGTDELGREAFQNMHDLGMDTTCIQWDSDHPTGTVPITFDAHGVADITINPDVAYDYMQPAPEAVTAAAAADCICYGTLAQRSRVSRETLRALLHNAPGALRLLDLNLRRDCFTASTVRESIETAHVLKLNDDEAREVARLYGLDPDPLDGFALRILRETDLRCAVVTLGDRGALAASRSVEIVYAPAFKVELVDALGSGDAFAAGFTRGLLSGWPLERSVQYGNALGALVAAQRGATEPLKAGDVDRMMKTGLLSEPDPRFGS